jgi:pimeloyl-ACP methyl ester carboxylesterase
MVQVMADRVSINGAELDMRERGSGEPVVFVHGAMGDECALVVQEPALVDNFRVIDYHQRGWGNSTWPEGPYNMDVSVADCLGVMSHLGVERAHMAGQSGGGRILLQLAQDAPEKVHTLTVLEPGLPSVLENPQFGTAAEKVGALYASGDKRGAMETFAKEVAGDDVREVMDRNMPPGAWDRWMGEVDTFVRMLSGEPWTFTKEDAARITQPTLNIVGANTNPYFRDAYETIRAWIPQAENAELSDANHAMLQMNPRGAAQLMADFFSRHPM